MLYPDFNDLVSFQQQKSDVISTHRKVESMAPGHHHSPFRGQGLEFDSVREYVVGDDIRSIDWRVTARIGRPHLKIFKQERERPITLCVDMNAAMRFGTRNTFKSIQAARVAAILGWRGIACQDRVSGCLFGDVRDGIQFFPPRRTRQSFYGMLQMLSEHPSERHRIDLDDALQHIYPSMHTGGLIYLISDFMSLSPNFQNGTTLSMLSKKCNVVFIAINDPADKAIFPVGVVGFSANGNEKSFVNTDSASGRKAYAEQWEENRKQLYEMTSALKIPTIELSTESDIFPELMIALRGMMRTRIYDF